MRRVIGAALVLVVLLSALVTGHVAWSWLGPPTDDTRVSTQVRFVSGAIEAGAGARMQEFFPEGEMFTSVLTGIAAARLASRGMDRDTHLSIARSAARDLEKPSVTKLFAGVRDPSLGVFYRGWRLLLLAEIAAASSSEQDRRVVATEADALRAAASASSTGILESYPGQGWPCDQVVGMGALVRAGQVLGRNETTVARQWWERLRRFADPGTGLLPHQVRLDGSVISEPRASSQVMIHTFLPDVDPASAQAQWPIFTRLFGTRQLGLVGIREYPVGRDGAGDVDSGPLILGVSASASAVAVAAARRNGDLALADSLDREGELLGLGVSFAGSRRYAAGLLPVGDAFLAWARSTPLGQPRPSEAPRPWWPLFVLLAALPGVAVGAAWHRGRHGRT